LLDDFFTAQGTLEKVIEQYLDESSNAAAASDVGQGNM
jgi:3-deoxy-D-manno-octulosonate 8-phosphate phosphatase (KDO 8-P phosphatase)